MNAAPVNVVPFALPKKPRVKEKDPAPDQRKVSVLPIRAINDKNMGDATFRALAVVCSYCNRAGITWVSQKRLAEDSKMSQQAISKHIVKLVNAGYIEVVKKGFRGERSNTIRVIFDTTVDTETAIAITNPIEDTRPPSMQDKLDPEGQRRVAQMIAKALKQPLKPKEYSMPADNETRTVKKMKEEIAKSKSKRTPKGTPKPQSNHNPQVVNEEVNQPVDNFSHSQPQLQPNHNLEVVNNTENTVSKRLYKGYLKQEVLVQLHDAGLTDRDQIDENLEHLIAAYKAEGINPTDSQIVQGLDRKSTRLNSSHT